MTTKAELLKVVKLQCQECMGSVVARNREYDQGAANLVEGCSAPECSLYPFRSGKDPWPKRKGRSDAFKKSNPVRSVVGGKG
jgi:hypothetical protein